MLIFCYLSNTSFKKKSNTSLSLFKMASKPVIMVTQEVKKRLSSEAAADANQSGRWKNQMRRVAHNGCCRRVAQTRALCSVLWKLLISENIIEAFMNIEIPLVKFWGFLL